MLGFQPTSSGPPEARGSSACVRAAAQRKALEEQVCSRFPQLVVEEVDEAPDPA
ncbi:hypothetical protein ACFY3N_36405 [Streptomyces sp. NPDC000348]|uniref:hypothetical protein n=1 Tax=Streptomyces sp. NPDC000348 TaxID=3364538 RepID=UPI00368CA520